MSNKIQSPEVVVVEASAGSGKTFALAKRYLQLLMTPSSNPKEILLNKILAITFTNKATIEMKERILDILKKISLGKFKDGGEENDIINSLGIDRGKAQERCVFIMDEIIKHYNFFQVQTIDSFVNALLSGCALSIDRSANFQIKSDYSKQLAYCFDLTVEEALENKSIDDLLEEFLQHYLFVENRNGWFPKEDILKLMASLFRLGNRYGGSFHIYEGQTNELIKKRIYIYESIKELSEIFPDDLNANIARSINNFLKKSDKIFEIANLPSCFSSEYPKMNKERAVPEEFEKRWKKIYKDLIGLIEMDARLAYSPYIKLFQHLAEFFRSVSRKEDVLFLEELNHKAHLLFDSGSLSVPELYYRFATRFRHYLIDEFQDTSILQWRNLKLMVEEALSTGGSLFYVGDKKQAIYRFRGGQARLFEEVKSEFEHFNTVSKYLTNNWRSQKAIVEFNNKIFSGDNLYRAINASGIGEELKSEEEVMEVVNIFKDSSQTYQSNNSKGYVCIERVDCKTKHERNEIMRTKLLGLLSQLRERFDYEDIAILTRDNDEVELVSSWFLKEKIPVESEKTLNIIENKIIREMISLLRFLNSPIDNLSFCAFLDGDIFCAASGMESSQVDNFIFQLHKEGKTKNNFSLYSLFRSNYHQIWEKYFEEFFKNVGFISPYELVSAIYNRFDIFKHFPNHQAFFMKFLELIKAKEEEYVGLSEFLSYLEVAGPDDLYVDATHSDSIKVLTIHKSKGLEFPVVILPFLRIDISAETGDRGTSSYIPEEENLHLLRITKVHRQYSKSLQAIYAQSYKKACIDELNNIYVALTRPKYELYVFIPRKSANLNNKAWYFIPQDIKEAGQQVEYPRLEKTAQSTVMPIPGSKYKNWIDALQNEFSDSNKFYSKEKILEGNIMHSMLSRIGDCTEKNLEELIDTSIAFIGRIYSDVRDFSIYAKKLKKLLGKNTLKHLFYTKGAQVLCEKEIVDNFGDLKRIDRLVITEKEIYVIDYKLSEAENKKHVIQVKEYINILKEIYPSHNIKGFLLYLDSMELREV